MLVRQVDLGTSTSTIKYWIINLHYLIPLTTKKLSSGAYQYFEIYWNQAFWYPPITITTFKVNCPHIYTVYMTTTNRYDTSTLKIHWRRVDHSTWHQCVYNSPMRECLNTGGGVGTRHPQRRSRSRPVLPSPQSGNLEKGETSSSPAHGHIPHRSARLHLQRDTYRPRPT